MLQKDTYYKDLLLGFIRNSISPEQVKELYEFIHREPETYSLLMDEPDIHFLINQQMHHLPLEISSDVNKRIQDRLRSSVEQVDIPPVPRKPLLRRMMNNWRWAAAAVFIIGIGLTIAVAVSSDQQPNIPGTDVAGNSANDVKAPESSKGTITLADGRVIALDTISNGLLAQQSHVLVTKAADGKIIYSGKSSEVVFNTLSNPRGSNVIDMTLADGSRVWLNAGSSVTYPVAFVGGERKVSIVGEAYFEVTHDAAKPFYVTKGNIEVKVLGTHFNVNTYDDEANIKITLLEGSVSVSNMNTTANAASSVILKPGQQAQISVVASSNRQQPNTEGISVINNTDVDQTMAWKNGMFNFNKLSLQEVLRQLSRWYDVDVVYEGTVFPKKFGGEVQRDLNLSEVLEGLQAIGVHFKIEGKKLIVMP